MSDEPMKGITCCGDCAYYNWKKHKCSRATVEGEAQDHFYADCPLPNVVVERTGRWIDLGNPITGRCSRCHHEGNKRQKYCYECGCRMIGGEDDE